MPRCIVHIGMHKTGSSSIQLALCKLADDRFFYARLGEEANHSLAIYSMFSTQPASHFLHDRHGRSKEAVDDYIAGMRSDFSNSVKAAAGRTLIISGEDISHLSEGELLGLKRYLQEHFDETAVVGYVRAPAEYMASAFQEKLKSVPGLKLDLEAEYRSYRQSFEKFDNIFGQPNVLLWKYDSSAFPSGCVVRDFCKRQGIVLPSRRTGARMNVSLPRQAVALLYTYRQHEHAFDAAPLKSLKQIEKALKALGKDRFRFSPDALGPVLARQRADLAWIDARLGRTLQEDLGEHQPGDVRDAGDLLQVDAVAVGKLLAYLGKQAPSGNSGATATDVAALMLSLRRKCMAVKGSVSSSLFRRLRRGIFPGARQSGEHTPEPATRVPVTEPPSSGSEGVILVDATCQREQRRARSGKTKVVQLTEMLKLLASKGNGSFQGIPASVADRLARQALHQIAIQIASVEKGPFRVDGLGTFKVAAVGPVNVGKKLPVRRVVFLPASRKADDESRSRRQHLPDRGQQPARIRRQRRPTSGP